ncbi:MAG: alpha/beta fold hydrolase [Patescibacteria group bacterium]|nr:alpha/beta fold hydrolase [Patescibacteria group bacterium]
MKFNIIILLFLIILIIILIYYLIYLTKNKIEMDNEDKNITQNYHQKKKISIYTEDGVEIVSDYYKVKNSKFVGILVHMMPSDRTSFKKFAEFLNLNGYSALAFDLRGHGESINSSMGKLNYKNFSDIEHQNSIFDLRAVSKFLENEGYSLKNQFLVGASIGANLSLQFLSQNNSLKAAVLLSPGKNYRGIEIERFLDKTLENKILVITTKEDFQSFNSVEIFQKKTPSTTIIVYEGNLHGTDIFNQYPDLFQKILNFLKEKLID